MSPDVKQNVVIKVKKPSLSDIDALSSFIKELRSNNRFILKTKSTKFINGLIKYAKKYKAHEIKKDEIFFRARKHELGMKKEYYSIH